MSYTDPNIQGWMALPELEWIFEKASKMETIVEIGSWRGRSTHALCSGCPGKVWAVDHFQGSPSERMSSHIEATTKNIYEEFMANVGHFTNLTVLKMDSVEAAKQFNPKSIDMIFIDGEHEYPGIKADLDAWVPKCKKLLCGHDIGQGGVRRALEEIGLLINVGPASLWSVAL